MNNFPVVDSAARQFILFAAIRSLRQSDKLSDAQRGLLALTSDRPMADIAGAVEHMSYLQCGVVYDDLYRELSNALRIQDLRKLELDDRIFFICNGATYECCSALFRIRLEEYRSMREQYFHAGAGGGRPRMPNEREKENICTDWARLKRESPNAGLRRRLRALHEIHHVWALNALTHILQSFGVLPAWDVLLQSGGDRMDVAHPREADQAPSVTAADASVVGIAELDKTSNPPRNSKLDISSNGARASRLPCGNRPCTPRTGNFR